MLFYPRLVLVCNIMHLQQAFAIGREGFARSEVLSLVCPQNVIHLLAFTVIDWKHEEYNNSSVIDYCDGKSFVEIVRVQ